MSHLRSRWVLVVSAVVLAVAAGVLVRTRQTQWDLRVYMECARTLASGGDPYATQPVVDNSAFQCLYPPIVTDLYRPFAAASDAWGLEAGERLFAALKVLSLFAILWLWRRWIVPPGNDPARLLFVVLAFGNPFWSDFRAGNAGSFEHLILWAGFAALIAERDFLFAALIALAAQPKILPVVFLPLLIVRPRPNVRAFVFGSTLAAAVFAANQWLHPGLLTGFFRQLADPAQPWRYERGPNNCAAVGLVQHALETAWKDRTLASLWAMRVGAVWSAAIPAGTAWALARLWRGEGSQAEKTRRAILLYAAAYALVTPRLKDYSFLLLIPPALEALESDAPLSLRAAIVVLALLNSTKSLAEKAGLGAWSLFAGYFKLYAVILVWAVLAFPRRRPAERRLKGS